MHKIKHVKSDSIAGELGIKPGDFLLTINRQKIDDVFEYRFLAQEEELVLEVLVAGLDDEDGEDVEDSEDDEVVEYSEDGENGEVWELEIEKNETEDLGLVFESGLMDEVRRCCNSCIFCFIDQMPPDMRPSLYFKDDDLRLSFLSGNYVTLTNLDMKEAERIARYHLSPLHISVHTTDLALRSKMLNNPNASKLFDHLELFKNAGIIMHFQIVLCKGINDGHALDESIGALMKFALPELGSSLSVVPVGLTKYREGLHVLKPFLVEDAKGVIRQVEKWQRLAKEKYGTSFVYCADEWYINSGIKMPEYDHYENFPQLENGVGMWALFERTVKEDNSILPPGFGIITGYAARGLMEKLASDSSKVYPIRNDFFGPNVTVSGLLTGRDIINQMKELKTKGLKTKELKVKEAGLILPGNMFKSGTERTLDDMTKDDIERALGVPIIIGRSL